MNEWKKGSKHIKGEFNSMASTKVPRIVLLILLVASHCQSFCPPQCQCDDEDLKANCKEANLEIVPIFLNPSIKHLTVRGNKIHRLEGGLSVYESLNTLDLSRNELKHLGQNQFAGQRSLQSLNISNNFLSSLHGDSFAGLGALQTLDLSRNILTRLENGTFRGLDDLVEMRLSHNLLSEVSSGAFQGLTRLRVLHVEQNRLTSLQPVWLAPMANLRFFHATSNKISTLPDETFKSLAGLTVVDLAANSLDASGLSELAFKGCRAVDTLDLSGNKFNAVPAAALAHMHQLSSLDLSLNPVGELTPASFENLFMLQKLTLNNMTLLARIDGETFTNNLKLKELSVENNPSLSHLPWGIFRSNIALEKLSFRGNSWVTLSPHQLPDLYSLKRLSLDGLPLECNCSVVWLWELYHLNRSTSQLQLVDKVKCASVAAASKGQGGGGVAGDPLASMTLDQLVCKDWSNVIMVVSLSILVTVLSLVFGAALFYKCRNWALDGRLKLSGGARRSSTACMHIKDDTMVYKSSLNTYSPTHLGQQQQQLHLKSASSGSTINGDAATYKAISSAGGYSPTGDGGVNNAAEPFYEVPKYANTTETSLEDGSQPKSSSSSACSKYSSGYVGSELWDTEFYNKPTTAGHGYFNPGANAARLANALTAQSYQSGSPAGSTATTCTTADGLVVSSNESNTGSSTASHGRPVFYSPASRYHGTLMWNSGSSGSSGLSNHSSPKYTLRQQRSSPPPPAPSNSKTLMLHHHQQPYYQRGGKLQQQQQQIGSLSRGGQGANGRRVRNMYV